ncbi:MAG: hypothetical protein ACAI35_27585 [Candidatus Methylacidiphilales bacterium]
MKTPAGEKIFIYYGSLGTNSPILLWRGIIHRNTCLYEKRVQFVRFSPEVPTVGTALSIDNVLYFTTLVTNKDVVVFAMNIAGNRVARRKLTEIGSNQLFILGFYV